MIPYTNPLGYKQLRTWQQANEILELTEDFIKTLPVKEPSRSHMDRSARSTVRNIEEGFRRTTTQEYVNFLGFSAGSNEELLNDFQHCLDKRQGDRLMGEQGVKWCRGESTMLHRQILSLEQKMVKEKTLSRDDMARLALKNEAEHHQKANKWLAEMTEKLREKDENN
ncbi:MAG: four helix bundle protein [Candidatus Berkelbacteria bacterium]|nr:four helix bundle protein [Candidatus Berkelbacteria bacterium]